MKIITFIIGQQKAGKTTFTRKAGTHIGVSVLNTGEMVRKELAKPQNKGLVLDSLYAPSYFDGLVLNYVKDGIASFLADNNKSLLFIDSFPRNQTQLTFFKEFVRQ